MTKDDDLIRELLFRYESEDDWLLFFPGQTTDSSEEEWRERFHVHLMMDEGLLSEVGNGTMRLTSRGFSYIEAIRDDNIWEKTKSAATKVGGASLRLMFDISTAYAKQKVSEVLGIPFG